MEQTLTSLIEELKRHDEASPFICQGLLIRIFHILSTKYEFSLSKQLRKRMNWILFEEITNYINNNLNNISIMQLSNEFHFQEDYFNRCSRARLVLHIRNIFSHCVSKKLKTWLLTQSTQLTRFP